MYLLGHLDFLALNILFPPPDIAISGCTAVSAFHALP